MAYTIRSRFSVASSPVFTGGDRLVGQGRGRAVGNGNGNPRDNVLDAGGGGDITDPQGERLDRPSVGVTTPTGTNVQAPGPQRTSTPALTLTPEQIQAIQNHPILQPLIAQLVAGESAGTVVLSPVAGDLGPQGPGDQTAAPGATAGGNSASLDPGANDNAPADYGTQTPTGPAGAAGDTGPQGPPSGSSGMFGTDIPTPQPTPTYVGDSVLDPGLYAPPMDAIDYTNSNLTAT